MEKRPSPQSRRKARRLALQAIYQWQLSHTPPAEIEAEFLQQQNLNKVDVPYFLELLRGVPQNVDLIDAQMKPVLDRPIEDLNPVELAILRIGIYEFMHRLDVPYRVVINEALELAKLFGAVEGFKYVNGILDRVARKVRTTETQSG